MEFTCGHRCVGGAVPEERGIGPIRFQVSEKYKVVVFEVGEEGVLLLLLI